MTRRAIVERPYFSYAEVCFCHFCKRCHVRCHINWVQDFDDLMILSIWRCILTHIFFWLNTENNANPYITKLPYLANTESVIMNHMIHHFHHLVQCYFYCIKEITLITADHLQWTIYAKIKSHVYTCIKKTSAKNSSPSNPSLDKWKCMSFIFVFYPFSLTS